MQTIFTNFKKRIPYVKTLVKALKIQVTHDRKMGAKGYSYKFDNTVPKARELLDGGFEDYLRTYPYLWEDQGRVLWYGLIMDSISGLPVSHEAFLARSKWLLQNYKGKAKYLGIFSGLDKK